MSGLESALELVSPDPPADEVLEARERRVVLREAIATLSDGQQQVVLLFYMGECTHVEIAEILGVTINVVKTRLYAARQQLRRHMDDIERGLENVKPSRDSAFADRVARMIQPDALKQATCHRMGSSPARRTRVALAKGRAGSAGGSPQHGNDQLSTRPG